MTLTFAVVKDSIADHVADGGIDRCCPRRTCRSIVFPAEDGLIMAQYFGSDKCESNSKFRALNSGGFILMPSRREFG